MDTNKTKQLHYLARSLALGIPAISLGIQIPTWITFAVTDLRYRTDFQAFYRAGYVLRTSGTAELYHGTGEMFRFIHPAYEALLFVPLAFLSFRLAYIVWFLCNLLIAWTILRVLKGETQHLMAVSKITPVGLTLAFLPVPYVLVQGQDSLLLALLLAVAFVKLKSGNEFDAGVVLGLGVFRFQFIIPIAILFLLWRAWRPLVGIVLSSIGALCASVAIAGISGQIQYFRLLKVLAEPLKQPVSRMSNIRAVLDVIGIMSPITVLLISVIVLLVLARLGNRLTLMNALLIAISASCLVSYHLFMHDLSVLLVPLLIIADMAAARRDYLGLGLAAVIVVLPEAIIMVGSADALWAFSIIPAIMIVAIKRSQQDATAAQPGQTMEFEAVSRVPQSKRDD